MSSRQSVASAPSTDSQFRRSLIAVRRRNAGPVHPERCDEYVESALRQGVQKNGATDCTRGCGLWQRSCQKCLDVAERCPLAEKCPALQEVLKKWLELEHYKDPPEGSDIARKIRDIAGDGHIRANQIVSESGEGGIRGDSQRMLAIVRHWRTVLKIQEYIEETPQDFEVWNKKRREDEALEFIRGLDEEKDPARLAGKEFDFKVKAAEIVKRQTLFQQFQRFAPDFMANAPEDLKRELHAGSKVVDAFFTAGIDDERRPDMKRRPTTFERKSNESTLLLYYDRHPEHFRQ